MAAPVHTVHDVSPSRLATVRAFLEAHQATAAFLLYTLERFGPAMQEHRDSGWFTAVEEDGRVVAVASATRRGHLLIETGGRADLGNVLVQGLGDRLAHIDGVVGEWNAAGSVWSTLKRRQGMSVVHESCNVVYVADLDARPPLPRAPSCSTRSLTAEDFEAWYPLFHALERQEGVEIHGARDQVRTRFAMNQWRWYGAFRGTELLAVVCLDMTVGAIGHVGGLYVQPAKRRQGLGRAVMLALMRQTHSDPRLDQLVLFTREDNEPARQLFEQLGFQSTGRFGFLLGAWEEQQDAGGAG